MKLKLLIVAVLSAILASNASALIVVNLTYVNPSDTVLTATFGGSAVVTSNNGNTDWNNINSNSVWRNVDDNTTQIFKGDVNVIHTPDVIESNARAFVEGGGSVTVNSVLFYTNTSINRSDFGFTFDGNPNPLFAVGETVNFTGTFTIDLASAGLTAGDFNTFAYTNRTATWVLGYAQQFALEPLAWPFSNISMDLSLSQVPEPGSVAVYLSLAGFLLVVLKRRQRS